MEEKLDFITKILSSSDGKDKILRTVCYSSLLLGSSAFTPKSLRGPLNILSAQISSARTVMRLFDDFPMLQYSLQCWRSWSEEDLDDFLINLNNLLDQLYYPVEHLVSEFVHFNAANNYLDIRSSPPPWENSFLSYVR